MMHLPWRVLLALFLLAPLQPSAQIYRWVDDDGNVHFSDKQPGGANGDRTETVELDVPEVREPDAGELRRRKLLRDAETEFNYRRDRESQIARSADMAASRTHPGDVADRLCEQARIRYGVLSESMPVYWTTDKALRPAWANDTYQGPRAYVSDDDRPALKKSVREAMQQHCAQPDDWEAQELAYAWWEHSNWCAAFKVKIATAKLPRTKTSRSEIEHMEAEYARDC